MRTFSLPGALGATALLGLIVSPVQAQFVVPTGYTYSDPPEGVAQGGTYNYFDETGMQLIDGVIGADNWAADLGNGPAYEWVAWRVANPTITFTFPSAVSLTQFQIGLDNFISGGVPLPTSITINGVVTNLTGNEIPSGQRGFVTINQAFVGNVVTINLADNGGGSWIFTDEIRFAGQAVGAAAPEPASLALLGLGVGCFFARRRRA